VKPSFPGLTGGSSFDSAMRKSIPILTTLAGGLRGLANRLLKKSARTKNVEIQAKVEIKRV
jgi:hypothetical protein